MPKEHTLEDELAELQDYCEALEEAIDQALAVLPGDPDRAIAILQHAVEPPDDEEEEDEEDDDEEDDD